VPESQLRPLIFPCMLLSIGHWQEETIRIVDKSPEPEVLVECARLIILSIDNDGHRADIPACVRGTDQCVSEQPSAQSKVSISYIDGKPADACGRQGSARQPPRHFMGQTTRLHQASGETVVASDSTVRRVKEDKDRAQMPPQILPSLLTKVTVEGVVATRESRTVMRITQWFDTQGLACHSLRTE
jgi:hypothetical protein